jgi:hypothetical protein
MHDSLILYIRLAGVAQLGVLVASALVPSRLNWKSELASLSRLNRQMHWVYGGYIVLSIFAFGLLSIFHAEELAAGSGLARGVCFYIAVFWGIRILLQFVFDVGEHLNAWWLKLGYHVLTVLFIAFTALYGMTALS